MNDVRIFESKEFGKIRTLEEDGRIWFCGVDVARSLGYKDTTNAIKQHCREDGVVIRPAIDSLGRKQNTKFITEGNLYRMTSGSDLPSAENFDIWIFDEVIPSLRLNGTYSIKEKIPTDHPGEVANLIKVLCGIQQRQGTPPHKSAENAKLICEQYGISLILDFVKAPAYEQLSMFGSSEIITRR